MQTSIRYMKDNVQAVKTIATDLKESDPKLIELDLNTDGTGKKPLGILFSYDFLLLQVQKVLSYLLKPCKRIRPW